jgi:hypothetical protein
MTLSVGQTVTVAGVVLTVTKEPTSGYPCEGCWMQNPTFMWNCKRLYYKEIVGECCSKMREDEEGIIYSLLNQ